MDAQESLPEEQQASLEGVQATYGPLARLASSLYFAVSSLSQIGSLYHFSFDWYLQLFHSTVSAASSRFSVQASASNKKDTAPGQQGASQQNPTLLAFVQNLHEVNLMLTVCASPPPPPSPPCNLIFNGFHLTIRTCCVPMFSKCAVVSTGATVRLPPFCSHPSC